jgi:uncharacterized protein (DUF2141 family)
MEYEQLITAMVAKLPRSREAASRFSTPTMNAASLDVAARRREEIELNVICLG